MSTESTEIQLAAVIKEVRAIDVRLQGVESDLKILRATCATKEELQRAQFEMQRAVTEMQRVSVDMAKAAAEMHKEIAAQTFRIVGWLLVVAGATLTAARYLS